MSSQEEALVYRALQAIEGEGDLATIRQALVAVCDDIKAVHNDRLGSLSNVDRTAVAGTLSDAYLLLLTFSDLLDEAGSSYRRARFENRRKGRPKTSIDRRRMRSDAVEFVERSIADGMQQEAAILTAMDRTGLSRSEIWKDLAYSRRVQGKSPSDFIKLP